MPPTNPMAAAYAQQNPQPTGKPDSTVRDLEKMLAEGKQMRARLEPVWFTNLAYYAGEQWLFWAGGKLQRPKLTRDRVLLVDNRIQPAVRRAIAKETKTRPTFESSPTSMGEDDVYSSLLAELYMADVWRRLRLTRKLRTTRKWVHTCGSGFWKVFWDSGVGPTETILLGPDGDIFTDQFERPVRADQFDEMLNGLPQEHADYLNNKVQRKTVAQGEIGVEVRSPFQIVPDPLAQHLDDAEHLFEETVKSTGYVRDRFGVDIKPDAEAVIGLVESRYAGMSTGQATSQFRGVKVKEFWAKPCSKYPKGKYTVWAGGKVLREEDYNAARLPYVQFTGIERPDAFWPMSLTEALRGPQTELNKAKSQRSENRNRIGNPALLVNKMSNVKYTGMPGERIEFDGTMGESSIPRYLQPPEMPAYLAQEIADINESISEVSGQNLVSSAQVPAGVTAAAAIQLLQEADDTMLGPDVEDMEDQLSLAGEMILELVAAKYTTARKLTVAGPDGQWDVQDFTGTMLRGNTQIRVKTGSTLPDSKAARQAEMTQMLTLFVQNGVPLQERNLRKFFQQYQAGALEALFGDLSADERQIHREHRMVLAGLPVRYDPMVDNNDAHVAGHQEEMKDGRFLRWPPEAQAALRAHLQEHLQAQAQQQQAAAAAQAAATGKVPEPPDPADTGPMQLPVFPERLYAADGTSNTRGRVANPQ